jgi:glutamate/aspartate transport system permease protein
MGSYNWNWPILLKEPYFGWIISGFGNTILIAVLAWMIAFPLGSAIGILRTVDNRLLRLAATTYVEIFRNIPLLVQMFVWYFVVPELLPADWGKWVKRDMPHPQFITAVMCLGLYTASRVAEQMRSASSDPARSAQCGPRHRPEAVPVYAHVLVPVAFRTIIPPLTSEFLGVFKNRRWR